MTHDIALLLELFPLGISVPESDSMIDLGQFATVRRYDEGVVQISEEEIQSVIALGLRTVAWAKAVLR